MPKRLSKTFGALAFLLPLLTACTGKFSGSVSRSRMATDDDGGVPSRFASFSGPAAQGQKLYETICISCHNLDPKKNGSVGPAIAGSSRALIEARVLHGSYPAGYHPKRLSQTMPQFPLTPGELDSLSAFLSATEK